MNNKKGYFIIMLVILLFPLFVNAESSYLYDVLKNEAESGGLAREYTGSHHDSFTIEPSKKIYHWYAENDEEGNQVIEKNNVIFGDYCWQMIRTTDTGGVKLIYNGISNNGICNNTKIDSSIGTSSYNPNTNSMAYNGYMYNPDTVVSVRSEEYTPRFRPRFASSFSYSDNIYTLINPTSSFDSTHHYGCFDGNNTCSTISYFYFLSNGYYGYYNIENGKSIEDIVYEMTSADNVNQTNSTVKDYIDNWYHDHLMDYTSYLEDTIYCNNRHIIDVGGLNPNGGATLLSELVFAEKSNDSSLLCINDTDKFSLSNNVAKLDYPIGLPTKTEMVLLNNNVVRNSGMNYYLSSPHSFVSGVYIYFVNSNGEARQYPLKNLNNSSVRPMISLKENTQIRSGTGTKEDPYVVKIKGYHDITIDNTDQNGIVHIDNTDDVEEDSIVILSIEADEGYHVVNIEIKDSENHSISYQQTENNNEYQFIMPNSNVTITPVFEKIKSSVNVDIVDETKEVSIEINDLTQVEYGEPVVFKVTPIKGYKINTITIEDSDQNEIDYSETDNKNEYSFIMPASNVKIIPRYVRVSNEVVIEDNSNTKQITIEVEDAKAVVYEDVVRFVVTPEEGYEVDNIEIKDAEGNNVEYRKTKQENEFEFTMPDTDVVITPKYRMVNINYNPKTKPVFFPILFVIMILGILIYSHKEKEFN